MKHQIEWYKGLNKFGKGIVAVGVGCVLIPVISGAVLQPTMFLVAINAMIALGFFYKATQKKEG